MKQVVWKYRLDPPEGDPAVTTIQMPVGAVVLTAKTISSTEMDGPRFEEIIYIWALVDPEARLVPRQFVVLPTGQAQEFFASDGLTYIDTVLIPGGFTDVMVFHIFEKAYVPFHARQSHRTPQVSV